VCRRRLALASADIVDEFEPVAPTLELIARFRVALGRPLELGRTQWGRRRVIPIEGGDFDGPPLVLQRLARGEPVDPASYYFRVSVRYETSSAQCAWLNRIVAVASAIRYADQVVYDAYVVR
jgi:hypothetical protein